MKWYSLIITFIVFIIDLISKIIIINYIDINDNVTVIKNFFYLTHVQNNGASFSILQGQQLLIVIVSIIFIFMIIYYLLKEKISLLERYLILIMLGGILGNLYDRLVYHEVIDFLEFHFGSYIFPVFNLADSFIVISVILLIIVNIRSNHGRNSC